LQSCHAVFDVSIDAGGDLSPAFEATEHALDDVALPVDLWITRVMNPAIALVWDDGRGTALFKPCAQVVAAISLITN
jgi:hypothetical protein